MRRRRRRRRRRYLLSSQVSPVQPSAHVQLYEVKPSTHVAPFLQGSGAVSHWSSGSVIHDCTKSMKSFENFV